MQTLPTLLDYSGVLERALACPTFGLRTLCVLQKKEQVLLRTKHAFICTVGMLDAVVFCCTLPTVLHQLFAFVFELMFGHRMQAYRLLVLRLCVARARPFIR